MKILVFNAGSSTQKSCLYEIKDSLPEQPLTPLWEAKIDWTKKSGMAILEVKTHLGSTLKEELPGKDRDQAIAQMLNTLWRGDTAVISQLTEIDRAGHRVVHGGEKYRQATPITSDVKEEIYALFSLAPEHNPVNLEGIEAISQILPNIPQVAVFDTAFHASIPPAAYTYPLPYSYLQKGIRRYGFHGISHGYCLDRVASLLGKDKKTLRMITCHLGNGCSLAAIRDGICVNTTMGYTPLEGLMMGSRSGSVDPGIFIHLMRQGYDAERLDTLLNEESGLKGLSGVSGDMRSIQEAVAGGNEQAHLALNVFVHRLRFYIGAMLASLGRLDALVFTGGVGENKPEIRAETCEDWECLGMKLDIEKNNASPQDNDIATADSAVRIFVIHTQEEWAIATECWKIAQEL